jgi:molybdenum cofactor cytidylyltransferase
LDSLHPHIATIILAAGESNRFGSPKQLADFNNKLLLQNAVDVAIASASTSVIVVLGAHEQEIRDAIDFGNASVLVNAEWREGMSSSIRVGVQSILKEASASILMVCDQPYVTSELLNSLIAQCTTARKSIVASRYGQVAGTPVLFGREYFPKLLALRGDRGARTIIERNPTETAFVLFPQGSLDIDLPSDIQQ